ncbi:PREDICTED: uncharacterized protein LOC108569990 [Nicrophorus vespilloides]|uniref:Uncharacterized protein LOC108569990 n=1 Tax=Nicrophorus vespilloides TaxID=110193 RepID=A0ABM1NKD2_NICVS|nr:PREDICTED: uncharacterized protein LOC108569990 [Nicrophorus vespilloides]XP_017787281.1 PREDICTED: uncharacterized protein LOC108569990 [Nicrophorus vespilloides]XP_017787282.1 PREDICTED: uncharacterized protein LOC108569990 [Nicrophorus vespilloides]
MTKKGSPDEIEDSAIWSSLVGNIVAVIMSAYFWFLSNGKCPKKSPNSYDTNSLNNAINDLKKMAEEIHNSTSKPYTDIESTATECTCTNENNSKSPSDNVSPTESNKEVSEPAKVTKGCSCQTIENMGSFRAKYTTAPYPIANSTKNQEYRPYHEPSRAVKKKVKSKAKRSKPKQKKNADLQEIPCYLKCFAEEMQNRNCGNKNCPVAVHYCTNKECNEDTIQKETATPLYQDASCPNEDVQADSSETSSMNCSSSCSVLKNTKHPCSYYVNEQYNESTQVTQVTEVTETVEETQEIKEFEQEESQTDPYSVTLRNYSQTEQEYDEQEEACTPCYSKRQCQDIPCTPKSGPSYYNGNAYADQTSRPKPATIQYAPNYYMDQQPVQSHQGYTQQQGYNPMYATSTDRGYRTLGVAPTAANYMKRIPQCEMNDQYKVARQRQLAVQKSNFPPDYYGSANARAVQPGAYMNLMINSPYNEKTINNQSLSRNEAYAESSNSHPFQRTNFSNCPTTCPNRRPLGGQQQPLSLMPNGAIPIRSSQNTLSVQKCSK